MHGEEFLVIPYTDSMKLEQGIIEDIEGIFAQVDDHEEGTAANIFSNLQSDEKRHEIKLSIQFSPGTGDGTLETANEIAKNVTDTARILASEYYTQENIFQGGFSRRHLRHTSNKRKAKHSSLLNRLFEKKFITRSKYFENSILSRSRRLSEENDSAEDTCKTAL